MAQLAWCPRSEKIACRLHGRDFLQVRARSLLSTACSRQRAQHSLLEAWWGDLWPQAPQQLSGRPLACAAGSQAPWQICSIHMLPGVHESVPALAQALL